jgi:hypothetical protein
MKTFVAISTTLFWAFYLVWAFVAFNLNWIAGISTWAPQERAVFVVFMIGVPCALAGINTLINGLIRALPPGRRSAPH